MTPTGQIERQSRSYRQGLVLGLTQAEIMLLLVFCLLLATAAVMKRKDDEIAKVTAAISSFQGSNPMNRMITDLVMRDPEILGAIGTDGSVSEPKIDEFWKEIVESREIVRELGNHGLSKKELKENQTYLSALMEIKKEGVTAEAMRAAIGKMEGIKREEKELREAFVKREVELREALAKKEEKLLKAHAKQDEELRETHARQDEELRKTIAKKDGELKAASAKIDEMTRLANAASGKDKEGHKWPPMISLSEAEGYFFKLGSAELSTEFESRLHDVVVPTLLKTAQEYEVDVIEVVGHTDELPIGVKNSNLDKDMVEVLKGNKPIVALKPGDNAGLGITRSVSVVRSLLQDERLRGLRVLPLSGAQLVKTDETLANGMDVQGDVKERRRIEIRLRKSTPPLQPKVDLPNAAKG